MQKKSPISVYLIFQALLFFAASVFFAQNYENKIQIETKPDTLHILPNKEYELSAIVRNKSGYPLSKLTFSYVNTPGFSVTITPNLVKTLPADSAYIWKITLKKNGGHEEVKKLWLQLKYFFKGPNKKDIQGAAFSSIALSHLSRETNADLITVEVKKSTNTLREYHPIRLYLFITNKSDYPITITNTTLTHPTYIKYHFLTDTSSAVQKVKKNNTSVASTKNEPLTALMDKLLEPHQEVMLPVQVEAKRGIRQGEHILVFDVEYYWLEDGKDNKKQNGNLLKEIKVNSEILGESDLLKLLGIPSFLFLPGFLLMITLGFLWKVAKINPESKFAFPKIKDAEFWLFGILGSFLMGILYWIIKKRNILEGYGFNDFVWIWILSMVVGFSMYASVWGIWKIRKKVKAKKESKYTFSTNDEPLMVLSKLLKRGLDIQIPQANAVIDGIKNQRVFLLEKQDTNGNSWGCPGMRIKWYHLATQDFKKQIEEFMDQKNKLEALVKRLKVGIKYQYLKLVWDKSGIIKNPIQLDEYNEIEPRRIIEGNDE